MQFETQREVKFVEPDVVPEVELRVHCDGPAEPSDSPEKPPVPSAMENSGATHSEPTVGTNYQAFSEGFGQTQTSRQPFSAKWEGSFKQAFNTAYFTVGTAAIATVCIIWKLPILWLAVVAFGFIALAAFRAAWDNRAHPADFAVNLPRGTRRSLRAAALLIPIPFFAIILAQPIAQEQLRQGQQLFTDGKYKDALVHFNMAATLNPMLEEAFMELADCYNFTYDYKSSLSNADKALQLDPTDGAAWASKAWALNAQDKYAEALPAALKAVNFAPESGQANHALADAYMNLGEYELALPPATKHVQIHDTESGALDLRANILEKLGRTDEAAKDRATSEKLDKSGD